MTLIKNWNKYFENTFCPIEQGILKKGETLRFCGCRILIFEFYENEAEHDKCNFERDLTVTIEVESL